MKLPGTSQHPRLTALRLSHCKITLETHLQRLRGLRLDGHKLITLTPGGITSTTLIYSSWLRLLNSTPQLTHLYLSYFALFPLNLSFEPITLANLIMNMQQIALHLLLTTVTSDFHGVISLTMRERVKFCACNEAEHLRGAFYRAMQII